LNYFQDPVQERISVSKRVKDIDLLSDSRSPSKGISLQARQS
jgi:hypothetical protein